MIEKDNILGFPLYRFYYDEKKVQGVLNSLLSPFLGFLIQPTGCGMV